jgi:hypothetical protein
MHARKKEIQEPLFSCRRACCPETYQNDFEVYQHHCLETDNQELINLIKKRLYKSRMDFWSQNHKNQSRRVFRDFRLYRDIVSKRIHPFVKEVPMCVNCYGKIMGLKPKRFRKFVRQFEQNPNIVHMEKKSNVCKDAPVLEYFKEFLTSAQEVSSFLYVVSACEQRKKKKILPDKNFAFCLQLNTQTKHDIPMLTGNLSVKQSAVR